MRWRPRWWPEYIGPPMPDKFHELATYNGEISRGIVHTPEHQARMAELQTEYDEWAGQAFEEIKAKTARQRSDKDTS